MGWRAGDKEIMKMRSSLRRRVNIWRWTGKGKEEDTWREKGRERVVENLIWVPWSSLAEVLLISWTFQLHESYFWKFPVKFMLFEIEAIQHEITCGSPELQSSVWITTVISCYNSNSNKYYFLVVTIIVTYYSYQERIHWLTGFTYYLH